MPRCINAVHPHPSYPFDHHRPVTTPWSNARIIHLRACVSARTCSVVQCISWPAEMHVHSSQTQRQIIRRCNGRMLRSLALVVKLLSWPLALSVPRALVLVVCDVAAWRQSYLNRCLLLSWLPLTQRCLVLVILPSRLAVKLSDRNNYKYTFVWMYSSSGRMKINSTKLLVCVFRLISCDIRFLV